MIEIEGIFGQGDAQLQYYRNNRNFSKKYQP